MLSLSKMASSIQPSATLAAGAKAKQMKAEGIDVFDFGLGEPDFTTPEHICAAARKAMQDGHTHYTPASGIMDLRRSVGTFYQKTYGIEYAPDEVIISSGAKHSIANVLSALCGPGDEVVIPCPYWVSYSDLVGMTGADYVLVPTTLESKFRMTAEQLKKAITPRTKLLMLNSPSNPTGSTYTRQELEAIADVIMDSSIAVMSDEIYEKLIYGDAEPTCFATLRPGLKDRTLTVSGVSKTYAMTGWRIGWTCGPKHVVKAMSSVQSQQTGNPCSISQHAALAALEGNQQCVADMRKQFKARRDLVCSRLSAIPGIKCPVPEGAFYAFFDVSEHFGRIIAGREITDSAAFCAVALEEFRVNIVAGSAFGAEGCVRLSFATSTDQLNGGIDQLERMLN